MVSIEDVVQVGPRVALAAGFALWALGRWRGSEWLQIAGVVLLFPVVVWLTWQLGLGPFGKAIEAAQSAGMSLAPLFSSVPAAAFTVVLVAGWFNSLAASVATVVRGSLPQQLGYASPMGAAVASFLWLVFSPILAAVVAVGLIALGFKT